MHLTTYLPTSLPLEFLLNVAQYILMQLQRHTLQQNGALRCQGCFLHRPCRFRHRVTMWSSLRFLFVASKMLAIQSSTSVNPDEVHVDLEHFLLYLSLLPPL